MKITPRFTIYLLLPLAIAFPLFAQAAGGGASPPPGTGQELAVDWKQTLATVTIGIGILLVIVTYLNGSLNREIKLRDALEENLKIREQLTRLEDDKSDGNTELFSANPETHLSRIRKEFDSTRRVLIEQLAKVAIRANLNLGLGITISLGAIALLLNELWGTPLPDGSWLKLFSAYFPKIFTCIFIEILAFFFLRLYRESLSEIRSCEADLRDLAARQVAIEATWDQSDPENSRTKIALEMLRLPARASGVETSPTVTPEAAINLLDKLMSVLAKKEKPAGD